MTSINAIKFNEYQGALICDEERGWNEEGLKIHSADKIRPIIEPELRQRYRVAACYGNTGTSTIGDELKFKIRKRVTEEFKARAKKGKGSGRGSLTIEEIAKLAFQVQTKLKHEHIDQTLVGRYGFTAKDFCQGFYMKDGQKTDIKQKEVIDEVHESITWQKRGKEMMPVFLNNGIVAGYEPEEGFRIFGLSLIEFYVEPVQEIFLADGSGRDMCNAVYAEYVNQKLVPERRGSIDPVEGIIAGISAINKAIIHDLGVAGYTNIVLIDGRAKKDEDLFVEIHDDRAKLASEIVVASTHGFLERGRCEGLIEILLFVRKPFAVVHEAFWAAVKDKKTLDRLLRGYKV